VESKTPPPAGAGYRGETDLPREEAGRVPRRPEPDYRAGIRADVGEPKDKSDGRSCREQQCSAN